MWNWKRKKRLKFEREKVIKKLKREKESGNKKFKFKF
jgi:hypothetical protein